MKRKKNSNKQETSETRKKLLNRFDWTDIHLTKTEEQAIEDIRVDYHDIWVRHRIDIGMNTEFKVKLSPKDTKAVYNQSLPRPTHLKEDLIVEIALMHKYCIITVLTFSEYASHIFAQRKPNGKLRLLVDLRKINSLIADDYTNNNHPVSTLSDAAQHLAGKSLFCKLDCSQAYHCLQTADQRSVEMLAFTLFAEPSPTKDLNKTSADLRLHFQISCPSTWTPSSKLANVLNTRPTLESQPIMLLILHGTFGQSSSSFASRD